MLPVPSPEKLAAWQRVRDYWEKNKLKQADEVLLDLEYEAGMVD
jgi:hypothetical protein